MCDWTCNFTAQFHDVDFFNYRTSQVKSVNVHESCPIYFVTISQTDLGVHYLHCMSEYVSVSPCCFRVFRVVTGVFMRASFWLTTYKHKSVWVPVRVSALAHVFADYFCVQVYGGILTYDAGKGTSRLTGQTVLWLLGPRGPSEKAMAPTRWHDFHSYWSAHNIWATFGTNSLIKRTVWESERDRRKEKDGFPVCDCTENKRAE